MTITTTITFGPCGVRSFPGFCKPLLVLIREFWKKVLLSSSQAAVSLSIFFLLTFSSWWRVGSEAMSFALPGNPQNLDFSFLSSLVYLIYFHLIPGAILG